MKIVHEEWDFVINLCDDYLHTLVIENKMLFRQTLEDILMQQIGKTGKLILSEGLNEKPFHKFVELIINPYNLDLNQKKIINGLYKSIENNVNNGELFLEFTKLNSNSLSLMEKIDFDEITNLTWAQSYDVISFLKIMQVKILDENDCLSDKIIEYMKLYEQYVVEGGLFIFINLKSWFSAAEFEELFSKIRYEHFNVLLIESNDTYSLIEEKKWIIDSDLCYIYNDEYI